MAEHVDGPGDPIEPRLQIGLPLRHQTARGLPQVAETDGILGGDDEAELVPKGSSDGLVSRCPGGKIPHSGSGLCRKMSSISSGPKAAESAKTPNFTLLSVGHQIAIARQMAGAKELEPLEPETPTMNLPSSATPISETQKRSQAKIHLKH